MEGPTPVSALIHAATLVTAGVFLLVRSSYLLEQTPFILMLLMVFGSQTAFFAGTIGIVQNDIKRVIAYSTCSQLGYMVFACGLSQYSVAIFHLANHALFKALLFLSAGAVIHGFNDEQDIRNMGSLINVFPLIYVLITIGTVALIGIPFFTGFYSKDSIIGIALVNGCFVSNFSYLLVVLAALCTAFYSTRILVYGFL
jgi:NADH:ubiquinone oxidoreductase subunit 5 (subunit L)/multisubunit Na+/H+ antiporter MnhA subunit